MGTIRTDGMYQADLVTFIDNALALMTEYKTDFNAVLTKLDGDTLVNGTDYNSTTAISATVPTRSDSTIRKDGMNQSDLFTLLDAMATFAAACKTKADALLAKLDADSGVTDVNYATLCTTASSAPTTTGMRAGWVSKGKVMEFVIACSDFFNELKTDYGTLLTKLDNDTGVTLTTYASGNPIAATLSTTV